MANAGRVLIIPKGEYSSSTTYEMLDLVYYQGTSWLAKKTVKGIEPSETNKEYWQIMFGFSNTPLTVLGDNRYIETLFATSGNLCFLYFGKATERMTLNSDYKVGVLPRNAMESSHSTIYSNARKWVVTVTNDSVYVNCTEGGMPEDGKPYLGYTMAVMLKPI